MLFTSSSRLFLQTAPGGWGVKRKYEEGSSGGEFGGSDRVSTSEFSKVQNLVKLWDKPPNLGGGADLSFEYCVSR